ncbi:hypothetical protein HLK59_22965 [Streptomyces sp. S3(2020)]|uniref:hypothetical protein n=1 Tax=Streptomyces sp. S3(2020) TaxID=2732044 RepID=UPI001488439E|nr:hypothetical protein [Streptomyces sp. S3(2020)]NNN33168.1 hypothetical protein [Streptomyces sp. S3(2020)]
MRTAASALVRHELRLLVSLVLWAAQRTHQARRGQGFGYARGEGPLMFGFAFVCVIESVTMSVLLRDLPAVHRPVLVLDVYTVVLVVGMHAANVVRPHVLAADSLRIRRSAHVDLRVPLRHIASVRRELRTTHHRADGELDLTMGARTTVTLELAQPVTHFTFFGRPKQIHLVRFHTDEPGELVRAITHARNAQVPGPPG